MLAKRLQLMADSDARKGTTSMAGRGRRFESVRGLFTTRIARKFPIFVAARGTADTLPGEEGSIRVLVSQSWLVKP